MTITIPIWILLFFKYTACFFLFSFSWIFIIYGIYVLLKSRHKVHDLYCMSMILWHLKWSKKVDIENIGYFELARAIKYYDKGNYNIESLLNYALEEKYKISITEKE